jgi:translation elongation factor EF-G
LREKLDRSGLNKQLTETAYYPSVHAAIEAFQRETQTRADAVSEQPKTEESEP